MKAIDQLFRVMLFIMLYKMVLELFDCSNENY